MSEPSPWMKLALAEAAAGPVSPNPAVGCVIVAGGTVVGRGHTQPPGSAHAEVMALRDAGERARGATAYVTLEPCSHWGRTPPCADALLKAGIGAVCCALLDPDPHVRGSGIARLRRAGVEVTVGDGGETVLRQLAAYLTHRLTGRPRVTAKFAASLDGRIATRTGDSRWISGPEARAWTRHQRSRLDAILVGVGTVLADDPQLTARDDHATLAKRQPLRVILDSAGRTPLSARVLAPDARTLIATTGDAPAAWREAAAERGAEVCLLPGEDGRVSLPALLDDLGRRSVLTLLVEGGSIVHGAFFDAGLVDEVQAIVAPLVIGGTAAPGAVGGSGATRMADAWRLQDITMERLGDDVLIRGALRYPDGALPAGGGMPR